MSHAHRYKVSQDSVFGLIHVNAVMRCVELVQIEGTQHSKLCGASLTKMLTYPELEKRGPATRPDYYYREPEVSNEPAT